MRDYAMFWGCTIPARFPSIEKATRLVLEDLDVHAHELDGYTCCPEGTLVKAAGKRVYHLTAARNLAIAGGSGYDMLTPCNGCYSTFKETQRHLGPDTAERRDVDASLTTEELEWPHGMRVLHLAEWLADVEGAAAVARRAVRKLDGMRIAVHYGCHLLRPQPAVSWDDPLHPGKVEALVAALGARVVDYPSKMQCCGGALDRVGRRDSSLAMAKTKLLDLQERDVDALVVVCPSCFQQFDLNQAALRRAGEEIAVPVLYLSELLSLCYGHPPEEIGLDLHRVSLDPFLERWDARDEGRERARRLFDLRLLEECAACGACHDDCPVAGIDPEFRPNDLVRGILDGDLDAVLADQQAWKCLECFTCLELCPSRIGLAETLRVIKEHLVAADDQPDQVRAAYGLFETDGMLGRPRESARSKLGLPPLASDGGQALKRMVAAHADNAGECAADGREVAAPAGTRPSVPAGEPVPAPAAAVPDTRAGDGGVCAAADAKESV